MISRAQENEGANAVDLKANLRSSSLLQLRLLDRDHVIRLLLTPCGIRVRVRVTYTYTHADRVCTHARSHARSHTRTRSPCIHGRTHTHADIHARTQPDI